MLIVIKLKICEMLIQDKNEPVIPNNLPICEHTGKFIKEIKCTIAVKPN